MFCVLIFPVKYSLVLYSLWIPGFLDTCIAIENNIDLEITENVNSFIKNSIVESKNYQSTSIELKPIPTHDRKLNEYDNIEFLQIDDNKHMVFNNIQENIIVSKSPKIIQPIKEEKSPILVTRFSNNNNVSCYANSVVQILFHHMYLATKIRNDLLGPIL